MANDLPEYDESLAAYQAAFAAELNQSLDRLPITTATRALDVPCGNGFYSRLIADRLGVRGRLDAVDLCPGYLERTRKRLRRARCQWTVEKADAYQLPYREGAFDLVWCAQSLISLDDPLAALLEMKRVVRRGGVVAILENDVYHHVLLPWPVRLEVPIQRAIQEATSAKFGSATKLAPVRRLPGLFEAAGLRRFRKHTFAADRTTPWSAKLRRFLERHLSDVSKLVRGRLTPTVRQAFREFSDPERPQSLYGDEPKDLSCLNALYVATK